MLKDFTVMDLIHTRSNSVATVKDKAIKFTASTVAELGSPAYIQFLVHTKNKQFAIRPCKEDAPNAIKFTKSEVTRSYPITVSMPAITTQIRLMAGWEDGSVWSIPGVYVAEDNALIFDTAAAKPPVTRGKRKPRQVEEHQEVPGAGQHEEQVEE